MKKITMDGEKMKSPLLTREELVNELRLIGLSRGMLLLVEADSEHLPYLVGGEQALVEALMEIVGYEGTLVTPSFTPELLDPACVEGRPFPYDSWEDIRRSALPYHPKLSMPMHSDPFVRQFLRNDGVVRSNHPLYSFAAWGKYAKVICRRHPLHAAWQFLCGRIDSCAGKVPRPAASRLYSTPARRKKRIPLLEGCAGLSNGSKWIGGSAGGDGRAKDDYLLLSGQCPSDAVFRS